MVDKSISNATSKKLIDVFECLRLSNKSLWSYWCQACLFKMFLKIIVIFMKNNALQSGNKSSWMARLGKISSARAKSAAATLLARIDGARYITVGVPVASTLQFSVVQPASRRDPVHPYTDRTHAHTTLAPPFSSPNQLARSHAAAAASQHPAPVADGSRRGRSRDGQSAKSRATMIFPPLAAAVLFICARDRTPWTTGRPPPRRVYT